MRGIIFGGALAVAVVAGRAGADVGLPEHSTGLQRGLSGLRVVVEPMSDDTIALGFSDDVLYKESVRRLLAAGLSANDAARELLHIRFNVNHVGNGACDYDIAVEIRQPVTLTRNQTLEAYASTWYTGYNGPFVCSDVGRLYPLALYAVDDSVAAMRGFQMPNQEPPVLPRPVQSMAKDSLPQFDNSVGAQEYRDNERGSKSAEIRQGARHAMADRFTELEDDLAARAADESAFAKLQDELAAANAKIAELEGTIVQSHAERYAALGEAKSAGANMSRTEADLSAALSALEKHRARVAVLEEESKANQDLAATLSSTRTALFTASDEAARLSQKVTQLEGTIALASGERYTAQATTTEFENRLLTVTAELARERAAMQTLTAKLAVAEAASAQATAEHQRLTNNAMRVASTKSPIDEQKFEEWKNDLTAAEREIERLGSLLERARVALEDRHGQQLQTATAGQRQATAVEQPRPQLASAARKRETLARDLEVTRQPEIQTVPMSRNATIEPPVSAQKPLPQAPPRALDTAVAPASAPPAPSVAAAKPGRPSIVDRSLPYSAMVNMPQAQVHVRPDDASMKIGAVRKGWKFTVVDIGGENQEWLQIQKQGKTGWVRAVSFAEPGAAAPSAFERVKTSMKELVAPPLKTYTSAGNGPPAKAAGTR